jgi:predicted RNA polymerase sigma factor
MAGNHRIDAVRGHLLERAGDRAGAHAAYLRAAATTTSVPEQRYLTLRASLTLPEH